MGVSGLLVGVGGYLVVIWLIFVDGGGMPGGGRGLEEGWRRIEEDRGGLEEDWRCSTWLGSIRMLSKMTAGLEALKMVANREKLYFTFFGFLPPCIIVSGSLACSKR